MDCRYPGEGAGQASFGPSLRSHPESVRPQGRKPVHRPAEEGAVPGGDPAKAGGRGGETQGTPPQKHSDKYEGKEPRAQQV